MTLHAAESIMKELAKEIAADLKCWPIGPSRILQIGHDELGSLVAEVTDGAGAINLKLDPTGSQKFRIGHWPHLDWGENNDIVICFDFIRALKHDERVAFLSEAKRSLAKGGRIIAIELLRKEDQKDIEAATDNSEVTSTLTENTLRNMGSVAGYTKTYVVPMQSGSSWHSIVFQRDHHSIWNSI